MQYPFDDINVRTVIFRPAAQPSLSAARRTDPVPALRPRIAVTMIRRRISFRQGPPVGEEDYPI